jgi:DNA-directed RNA polymerase sigma subunit (sigma70/sigma32)
MKCYEYYANSSNKICNKDKCRYWLTSKEGKNCVLVCAKKGPSTLQDIGEIFNITRMRVCQLEKTIIEKIKKRASSLLL